MARNKQRPASAAEPPSGRPGSLLASLAFALVSLLLITVIWQAYLSKVPGVNAAVTWVADLAVRHVGLYTFSAVLTGTVLAVFLARVPEVSFHGFNVRNPFHWALAGSAGTATAAWAEEKRHLQEQLTGLELGLRTAREQLAALEAHKETAALYEFALERTSHQDSVIERLLSAFYQSDTEFDTAYSRSMDWLAHFATELVVNHDRSQTCQILHYDAETDSWTVAGEVGSKPGAADHTPYPSLVFARKALAESGPLIVGDLGGSRDRGHGPRSLLAMPVFHHRRGVGVISLCSGRPNAFGPHDLKTVQMAVDLTAIAMGLYRIRRTDRRGAAVIARLNDYLTQEGGDSA
jgi:hypothetical protein